MKRPACVLASTKARIGIVAATLSLVTTSALGATVAIIDSGVDVQHTDLSPRVWVNPGEVAGNGADDDGNGLVNDVNGWNFAEDNDQLLDRDLLGTFSDDCYKFFKIQGKVMLDTATDEEKKWIEEKRKDATFLSELQTFGNFVHGSHVSGIASTSRSTERLIGIKIIPTKTPGLSRELVEELKQRFEAQEDDDPLGDMLVQFMIGFLVDQQVGVINKAFDYTGKLKADVANGSFGVSYAAAKTLVEALLGLLGREPSEDEVKKHCRYLIEQVNEKARATIKAADRTLFVFAAGNDGTDNDEMPIAPGSMGEPNTISVAATLGVSKLAKFSNYGASSVDIAAPGVVINSTIPGNKYMELSGTSMASPYVAEVAALVIDANPKLGSADTKKILMGTVDVKDYLAGKVKSGGTVNEARAVKAAKLAAEIGIDQAIAKAKAEVPDVTDTRESLLVGDDSELFVLPLPSPM